MVAATLVAGALVAPAHAVGCDDPRGVDPPPADVAPRCDGASPGMSITVAHSPEDDEKGYCILGFFFAGSDGQVYATMPGSCHLGQPRPAAAKYGVRKGPVVHGTYDRPVGEVAFALHDGQVDFGLVRLFAGISYTEQQCYWGGPTRIDSTTSTERETVRGLSIFSAHQVALINGRNDPHRISGGFGELGAIALGALVTGSDGSLLGQVITSGAGPRADTVIERPQRGLSVAQKALRLKLRLLPAPTID